MSGLSGSHVLLNDSKHSNVPSHRDECLYHFEGTERKLVQSILRKHVEFDSILDFYPLQGGYSTRVFQFSSNHKKYVLRILPKREQENDNFFREISASVANSHLRIAPHIYATDQKNGIILMEYIEHRMSMAQLLLQKPLEGIDTLAKLIKKMHTKKMSFSMEKTCMYQRIRKTMAHLPQLTLTKNLKVLLNFVDSLEEDQAQILCPSHNDLNPNNILVATDHTLKLIDWEMAGANDPFYDLATLCVFLIFDTQLEERLLYKYLGYSPSPHQIYRYRTLKIVSLVFYGTILQVIANHSIFWEKDILDDEVQNLNLLYQQNNIWTHQQFQHSKKLSLFGMSLLKEAYLHYKDLTLSF